MELLGRLCRDQAVASETLSYLQRLRLARQDAQGALRYHDEVRTYLLAWWRRERPQLFQEANRIALAHFTALTEASSSVERPIYEREKLYHLLVTDETAGIAYLSTRFEDACERYQLGHAEQLVAQLTELNEFLADSGRSWARYLEARLDMVYHRGDAGEGVFADLASRVPDSILRAVAGWSLGQLRVSQRRWSQGISLYRASLRILQRDQAQMYAERVMLTIGDAYYDLANTCGGLHDERDPWFGSAGRLLHVLRNLPFLAYNWIARRLSFFPIWYGTNYQDWVIVYLLGTARRWYLRAERELRNRSDVQGLIEARLCLANLAYQLGYRKRARRRYATLLTTEAIKGSLYRTAQIRLGQGRAFLDEGDLPQAQAALAEALATFVRFLDDRSAGYAAALLGRAYLALDQPDQAALAYLESIRAFGTIQDQVARTQSVWALEDLTRYTPFAGELKQQIEAAIEAVSERHYITRFPDLLLRRFRRLALLGALPLTYYALPVVAFLTWGTSAFVIEGLTLVSGVGTSVAAKVASGAILIACATLSFVLVTIWLYRLIYSLLGMVTVYLLGYRLVSVEQDQPSLIVLDIEGITRHDIGKGASISIQWFEVAVCAARNYYRWSTLITLFSNTIVAATSGAIVTIDAITAGYDHMKQDIARHLSRQASGARQRDLNFVVLDSRWMLATIAVSLAFAQSLSGKLSFYLRPSPDQMVFLILTPLMISAGLTLLLLFPAVTLWRLVYYRSRIRSAIGYQVGSLVPFWLLWLATVVCTLIAGLWIFFLLLYIIADIRGL
jgi:hypothetical protein